MKSITEILGGAQILLGISFEIQDSFEEYLTNEHRAFLSMLRVLEEHLPLVEKSYGGKGRPPYKNTPILKAFLAKIFFRIGTNEELLNRLLSDSSLRRICGFGDIPSSATFSRRMKIFSEHHIPEQILYPMVRMW